VKLFEVQQNGQNIEKVSNWLFVTARNLCLNSIRDNRKEVPVDYAVSIASIPNNHNHRMRMIIGGMASLDIPLREALILKSFEDLSYKQISEVLGVTVPAVKSLLYKARLQIRELINKKQ
jgi:RNA polymerase sigma-70 factor (ECF subfamily)